MNKVLLKAARMAEYDDLAINPLATLSTSRPARYERDDEIEVIPGPTNGVRSHHCKACGLIPTVIILGIIVCAFILIL